MDGNCSISGHGDSHNKRDYGFHRQTGIGESVSCGMVTLVVVANQNKRENKRKYISKVIVRNSKAATGFERGHSNSL